MNQRKTYFVSIDKEKITETAVGDIIEYKIEADDEELQNLKNLFRQKSEKEKNAAEFQNEKLMK